MTIILNEGGIITIVDECYKTSGGRAGLKFGDKAYIQIEIEKDGEGVLISLTDNLTDIDGHWTPVHLSKEQLSELIAGLNKLK